LLFATPPFDDVQVAAIDVMEAPLAVGAANATRSERDATRVTLGLGGGAGEPTIALFDAVEAGPLPRAFDAVSAHVYVFRVVRPFTTTGVVADPACEPVLVTPPFADLQVATTLVIAAPLLAPGVYETFIEPD
jgi:hypothetical protein